MKVGYMRVSTHKQNLNTQREAFKKYGVEKVYEEKASGRNTNRSELNNAIGYLRPGDTLYIYDLSRLGRTVQQVMKLIDYFSQKNIGFVSIKENLDITTPTGKMIVGILASINQMQVEIQNEKIREGLANAKANGKQQGRKSIPIEKVRMIKALDKDGYSNKEIAETLGISRRTVIKYKCTS